MKLLWERGVVVCVFFFYFLFYRRATIKTVKQIGERREKRFPSKCQEEVEKTPESGPSCGETDYMQFVQTYYMSDCVSVSSLLSCSLAAHLFMSSF